MDKRVILRKTEAFVKGKLIGDGSAHDWWHVARVVNNALTIARREGGDLFAIELGALLHDIADWKFTGGDTNVGPNMAREWLAKQKVDEVTTEKVVEIVGHVSYRGGTNKHVMQSCEGKIVQDADRLDGIGAIGIARTFAFGGSAGRAMYDPNDPPRKYKDFKDFRDQLKGNHTINHFHEKLLLLKDKMNTPAGRAMAEHRRKYMEQFLEEFYAEWDGKL